MRAIENPWTMTGSLQRYFSAGVLAIWGTMLGYFVISGRLASYLHPSFHIWTAASAIVLVLLAAGLLFLPEHEDLECESCCDHLHDQRTPVRSGVTAAILVLPIVLAASISPDQFGAVTVNNRGTSKPSTIFQAIGRTWSRRCHNRTIRSRRAPKLSLIHI